GGESLSLVDVHNRNHETKPHNSVKPARDFTAPPHCRPSPPSAPLLQQWRVSLDPIYSSISNSELPIRRIDRSELKHFISRSDNIGVLFVCRHRSRSPPQSRSLGTQPYQFSCSLSAFSSPPPSSSMKPRPRGKPAVLGKN
ncbi:unnamed protein product, partial [Linum tenue]